MLTRDMLPKHIKNIPDEVIDSLNNTLAEPELLEVYRDNFINYIDVLQDGKFKTHEYLNAIKYCTHKLMGNSNIDSYIKTFPDRYANMVSKGIPAKDIASQVSVYNKSKLVNKIMEQSMIPSWILNQDLYQKAINVQAELMLHANSEKVRSDAANSLLNHLKPPETKKVELDIGIKENKAIDDMRILLAELSAKQKHLIDVGLASAKDIAETKIIQGTCKELDND